MARKITLEAQYTTRKTTIVSFYRCSSTDMMVRRISTGGFLNTNMDSGHFTASSG